MNSLNIEFLLIASILWPFLLFFLSFFKSIEKIVLTLITTASLPLLITSININEAQSFEIPWLLLGSTFLVDIISKQFLLLAGILWSVAIVYTQYYFTKDSDKLSFFRFFLLAMIGNIALIISSDLASFYFAFTLMSFASYGLIAFNKNIKAIKAALIYIILVIVGEVMIFAAFIMAAYGADSILFNEVQKSLTTNSNLNLILFFAFLGFGIKAGFLGLHFWLPLAHPVAPAPASAVLSGSMIKAGIIALIKFFPLGLIVLESWGMAFIVLGFLGTIYAVIVGFTQNDSKTVLAYSSISKMGIISVLFGLALIYPNMWQYLLFTILFYVLYHGLSKGALFLGAGISGSTNLIHKWLVWILLFLPILTMIGAPFTSGALAKYYIKENLEFLSNSFSYEISYGISIALSIATIATTLLMFKFLYLIAPNSKPYGKKANIGTLSSLIILIVAIAILPFIFIDSFIEINDWFSLFIIFACIVVFMIFIKLNIFNKIYEIPAGDILVIYEFFFHKIKHHFNNILTYYLQKRTYLLSYRQHLREFIDRFFLKLVQTEELLSFWTIAIFILLLILVLTSLDSFKFLFA